jgi:hypothetical protein
VVAVLQASNHQVNHAIDSLLHLTAGDDACDAAEATAAVCAAVSADEVQSSAPSPPPLQPSGAVYVGVPQRTAPPQLVPGPVSLAAAAPGAEASRVPLSSAPVVASSTSGPVSLLPPRNSAAAAAASAAADSWQSSVGGEAQSPQGGGGRDASRPPLSVFAPGGTGNGLESAGANFLAWMAALLGPPPDGSSPSAGRGRVAGDSGAVPSGGGGPGWSWERLDASGDVGDPQVALALGTRWWEAVEACDTSTALLTLLSSLPRCRGVLGLLHTLVLRFAAAGGDLFRGGPTVSVPQRLEAWRIQLAAMCGVLVAELLRQGGPFTSARWHHPHRDALQLCVETLVLSGVHDTLMPAVRRLCERADDTMNDAMQRLARVPPQLLGVRREWVPLATDPEAVRRLRALQACTSPHAKVCCLRDSMRRLADAVQGGPADPSAAPAADDMLSLMVVLLARSRMRSLVAEAVYCDTFLCMTEATSHKGELGYALATFMATCEYVRSKDVARLCAEWEDNERAWEAQLSSDGPAGRPAASPAAPMPPAAAAGHGSDEREASTPPLDPLGALSGVADLAAGLGSGRSRPLRPGSASPMGRPRSTTESLEDSPWLLTGPEPATAAHTPTASDGHGVTVQETSRGSVDVDPLSTLANALHDVALDD